MNKQATMTTDTDNLITADDLSLIRGQRLLFKQLSFTLKSGQAIHLSGHNGSGKTSLFKVLTGMLSPNTGRLELFGKTFADFEHQDYEKLLYLGHQTAIKHELSVLENLRLNSQLFDKINATDEQLYSALSAVGLARFDEQLAGKLSAGQKRRVMLARLWLSVDISADGGCTDKPLWLLDEPLTALDVGAIDDLQALIDKHLSFGGGVVFTSHQPFELSHPIKSVVLGGSQ